MGRDLTSKDKYTDFHKHIQINLNLNVNQEDSLMEYYLTNLKRNKILTDKIEIINIDIEKLNEICYTKGVKNQNIFTKVLGLIGAKDKEHFEIFKEEKGIVKEIMEKAQDYIIDNDLVEVLDYEKMRDNREIAAKQEGFTDGFTDGFNDGKSQGANEEKNIIAKNMLKEKVDTELICKVTGLTKEEIEKLN